MRTKTSIRTGMRMRTNIYVHPHPHTQFKKLSVTHTYIHTRSMQGFPIKIGTGLKITCGIGLFSIPILW